MIALRDAPVTRSAESLQDWIVYLENDPHPSMRQALAGLDRLSEQIARAKWVPLDLVDRLQRELLDLTDILETYLSQQECQLFPMISELTARSIGMNPAVRRGDRLGEAIERATLAQQEALAAIERVQTCLCHPEWADRGPLVEKLIDKVHALEVELAAYSYVQEEIVFPKLRDRLDEHRLVVERPSLIPR